MSVQLDKAEELTEREAIKHVVRWLPTGYIYLPRFTPTGWWENDLCAVTSSDYWVEFEVKLTRADFLRDRAKEQRKAGIAWDAPQQMENKHDLLANTDRGPSRFFYVVKDGVATLADIPPWAGLITLQWREGYGSCWSLRVERSAPKRHRRPDPDVRLGMFRASWYRGIGKLL